MCFSDDMTILELDSFDTAYSVAKEDEGFAKRRFLTLFLPTGKTDHRDYLTAMSFTGETLILVPLNDAETGRASMEACAEDAGQRLERAGFAQAVRFHGIGQRNQSRFAVFGMDAQDSPQPPWHMEKGSGFTHLEVAKVQAGGKRLSAASAPL